MPRFRPHSNIASCDCPAVICDPVFRSFQRLPISSRARRAWLPNLSESCDYKLLDASGATSYIGPTSSWWTGEDSNLRSPQGAADLQSAGFSHSPTRPRNFRSSTSCPTTPYRQTVQEREGHPSENTKRTRVKRHQPVDFALKDSLRSIPPRVRWWSWRRELNPRPSDYKSDALPAELRQRSQTDKE